MSKLKLTKRKRYNVLTPREYVRFYRDPREEPARVEIVPPEPGTRDLGRIAIIRDRRSLKSRQSARIRRHYAVG